MKPPFHGQPLTKKPSSCCSFGVGASSRTVCYRSGMSFNWWNYEENDGCGGYDWLSFIVGVAALCIIAAWAIDYLLSV